MKIKLIKSGPNWRLFQKGKEFIARYVSDNQILGRRIIRKRSTDELQIRNWLSID